MPTANYVNKETGKVIDHFTQGKLQDTIVIDGVTYERDYTQGALNFKFVGAGFYENDYKHK